MIISEDSGVKIMLVANIRAGLVANIRDLKTERVTLEKEKQQLEKEKVEFRAEMEMGRKELKELKLSEDKFKAEVSKKNAALLEREWSVHKNEDKLLKLAGQNSEEESRLRSANLYSLLREKKQQEVQEVQERREARIALERLELSRIASDSSLELRAKRESAKRKSFSKRMTGDCEWVLERPRRK